MVNSGVTDVSASDRSVTMELADGTTVRAATVLLATGVQDDLPALDGLADRWGKSVFNCPFCDGWEHRDQPVVVIDAAPGSEHLASLLRSWTPHVTVVSADEVAALAGDGDKLSRVVLRDGRTITATAAFLKAPVIPRSSLARRLGCELDDDGYIITNDTGATSHPLVWAAGDVRRPPPLPHQVVLAAADGSTAAIAIHKAFVAGSHPDLRGRSRCALPPLTTTVNRTKTPSRRESTP
jgi:thioredoxin reductase (NADPH)